MLSQKAKYGLKAMIHLAARAGEGPVATQALAEHERIPRKFLEQILLELQRGGLLTSRKGRGGGYQLARPPALIPVGAVVRLLDGPLAPIACVSVTAYRPCPECADEATCGIRLVMKEVRDAIADILDGTSLEGVLLRVRRAERARSRG